MNIEAQSRFVTLHIDQLEDVNGGAGIGQGVKTAAKFGGKVLSKAALPLTVGLTAYDAYSGYADARAKGATVPQALGEGALEGLNSLTLGASNWLLGR